MRWDVPLRLLGGLHYLALAEGIDPWTDVRSVLAERKDWLRAFVAEQQVQTNEVQRCWALLPAFLLLGEPVLDLVELGPSAGLNLVWDRYRYRYGDAVWGPEGARLELSGELRRPFSPELLSAQPQVRVRRGIDLHPIDVTVDDGARLLECFVWPDQTERIERLRRAIEVVRDDPPELVEGDYVELLPELLFERDQNAMTVVFETISLGYLTDEQQEQVAVTLEEAGREGPLAWISAPSGEWVEGAFGLGVRVWPGPERRVALMDFHGAWLEWLDA
jgi:hypothetical protein